MLELALAMPLLELPWLEQRCSRRLRIRWSWSKYRSSSKLEPSRCCSSKLEPNSIVERAGNELVLACSNGFDDHNELRPTMQPRTGPQLRPTYKRRDSY
jgi:hypothetical protein